MENKYKVLKYNIKYLSKAEKDCLKFLCYASKKIYNIALNTLLTEYENSGKLISWYNLNKKVNITPESKLLNSYCVLCTNRFAYNAMLNFTTHHGSLPKNKKTNCYFHIITENQNNLSKRANAEYINLPVSNQFRTGVIKNQIFNDSVINNYLQSNYAFSKIRIRVPKIIQGKTIKRLSIVPRYNCKYFEAIITYIDDGVHELKKSTEGTLAIDLGINNLATCVNSKNAESFIVDGRKLKSAIQYYNKYIAETQSKINKHYTSNKLASLLMHKSWTINDYIYKSARIIINYALDNELHTIVIGCNYNFKKHKIDALTNKRKARFNQIFNQVPLLKFAKRIIILANQSGIKARIVNESFTSLCSFYDDETIERHDVYLGKRIHRGLFLTSAGAIVNADVNAALNILRKSKTEDEATIARLMNSGITIPTRRLVNS